MVEAPEVGRNTVHRRQEANRARSSARASWGELTHFNVGNFALVMPMQKPGRKGN